MEILGRRVVGRASLPSFASHCPIELDLLAGSLSQPLSKKDDDHERENNDFDPISPSWLSLNIQEDQSIGKASVSVSKLTTTSSLPSRTSLVTAVATSAQFALDVGNAAFGNGLLNKYPKHNHRNKLIPAGQRPKKTSRYIGVSKYKRNGSWRAHIWTNDRQYYLGAYASETAAARSYDKACLVFRGEKARLNFTRGDYDESYIEKWRKHAIVDFVKILQQQSYKDSTEAKLGLKKGCHI